jgi:SAM-dependent methyltransferase
MDERVYEGYRHCTRSFLHIYDLLVLVIYGPLVWRCATGRLVELYRQHCGRRHVDVGPGTGYFLERSARNGDVLLVDPNPNVLAHASRRLAQLRPATVQADVLQPHITRAPDCEDVLRMASGALDSVAEVSNVGSAEGLSVAMYRSASVGLLQQFQ